MCYKIRMISFWLWFLIHLDSGTSLEYIYYSKKQSWNTATRVCRSIDGRLATVNNQATLDSLKKIISKDWGLKVELMTWIGLHKKSDTELTWSDPECTTLDPKVWTNFKVDSVDNDSVDDDNDQDDSSSNQWCHIQRYEELTWESRDCSYRFSFICERTGKSNLQNDSDTDSYKTTDDKGGLPIPCQPGSETASLDVTSIQASITMTPAGFTETMTTTVTTTVINSVTINPTPVTAPVVDYVTMTTSIYTIVNTFTTTVTSTDDHVTPTSITANDVSGEMTSLISPSSNAAGIFCTFLPNANLSKAELADILGEIVVKLTVNKRNLSSAMRKKSSAPDYRITSRTLGCFAGVMIFLPILLLFVVDLPGVVSHIRILHQ